MTPLPLPSPAPTSLPVVGIVRVVDGSPNGLHELPVNASLLDRIAIHNTPAYTTDGLLRELPGFDRTRSNSTFTNYGQLRVSFDGAGNDRGLVLIDGVPAQDAFGGQVDWAAYPPEEIVRAELLRDSGSALYGSGAIGGVLRMETLGPSVRPNAPLEGHIALGLGAYDERYTSLFARGGFGSKLNVSLWSSDTRLAYNEFSPAYMTTVGHAARTQSDATQLRLRYAFDSRSVLAFTGLYGTDAQDEGRPNYTFGRTMQQYGLQYARATAFTTAAFSAYERQASILNTADAYPSKPGTLLYVQHVLSWENGWSGAYTVHAGPNETQFHVDRRAVHSVRRTRGASARQRRELDAPVAEHHRPALPL